MDVSGGKVTIRESTAQADGGRGGSGSVFLVLEQEDKGCPPRSGTQSVMGSAVLGRRVLRVQGLRGLQVDAALAVTQQVIFFQTKVCLARADSATAVCLIKVKMAENNLL